MSDFDSPVYLLIRADEMSSLFAKAKDDDVAAESIYLDEANRRLKHLGVIVLEVEMPGVRAGGYIQERLKEHGLWQAPPSPDAGAAFTAALERVIASAKEEQKAQQLWMGKDVRDCKLEEAFWDESKEELTAAKAALLSFAPGVRITEEMVDAGADALEHGATHQFVSLFEIVYPTRYTDEAIQKMRRDEQRDRARRVLEAALNGGAHE